MTAIDVRQLTKEYGGSRVLDGLTFSLAPGQVTGFLGPNGSGKSTTLRLLLGLARPTSGTALVAGRPYAALTAPLRRVGALLDADAAHPRRSARDHLRVLAASNDIPAARVDEVLDRVGLTDVAGRRTGTYSLGMRQRLGIAAALLGDPDVLVLDEPANGLDPEGMLWLRGLLRDHAAAGGTALVSSHLMHETARYADRLLVIGGGLLLADQPLDAFLADRTARVVRFRSTDGERLAEALRARGHQVVPGEEGAWSVPGARPEEVGAIAAAEGLGVLELRAEEAGLEDAYLALTEGTGAHRGRQGPPAEG
ncbi:ABC-2 type transport system ATP-binding protein [Streptomyces sp. TverLS-915]|uniref:ATP-binding cassette domain-containing protein n=1 Tax=Streptomyces sp. TverLS-915 TaxID=1839763 RepID=UPI00081D6F8B|nr:ATP-binding cassette domain-containing protein [Streptomyces sp. TverLS-915]SCD54929.1 ABC-2 type transport system ATP-binding protein [Streptomyces sp. TverLS-915]